MHRISCRAIIHCSRCGFSGLIINLDIGSSSCFINGTSMDTAEPTSFLTWFNIFKTVFFFRIISQWCLALSMLISSWILWFKYCFKWNSVSLSALAAALSMMLWLFKYSARRAFIRSKLISVYVLVVLQRNKLKIFMKRGGSLLLFRSAMRLISRSIASYLSLIRCSNFVIRS